MEPIFNDNDLKILFPPKLSPELPPQSEPEIQVEIEKPPQEEPPEKTILADKFSFPAYVKFIGLFIGVFLISYFLINANALESKLRYFYDVSIKRGNFPAAAATPTTNPFDPTAQAMLSIPKIGVNAPVIWNISEENFKDELLKGVVHSQGTALPGQVGNIFITGHSSYYSWVSSDYKDVFALLDKLEAGDQISISYSGKTFNYKVTDRQIVSPADLSVMDQNGGYNLSLMTCVPVGTNLNRLIVRAVQEG